MLHKLVHDDQVISEYWHGIGYVKLDQIIHGDLESKKMIYLNLVEKTNCQIQIKCITDNCLQMYKHHNYLQIHLHLIQTIIQASKLLKHMYRHKHIKNAKLIKAWIILKPFIELYRMK